MSPDPDAMRAEDVGPGQGRSEDTALETRVESDATSLESAALLDELERYVVIGEIGSGGMGTVLRAYDPRLQREVALKVLKTRQSVASAARMVREARAMAKLSSPHVVSVFDVVHQPAPETKRQSVVIAMELIEGETLRQWMGVEREPSDILEQFRQAGLGLAAAHQAGLLHRDFKPENVLVGRDGRTRVTDFGLARARAGSSPNSGVLASASGSGRWLASASVDDSVTQAGTVVGTPAYMAPEQHRGAALTEAVDQYAFCLALWEALVGSRPFAGLHEKLLAAKDDGPPPWPTHAPVNKRTAEAIRRGLAARAHLRWASMPQLLDEIYRASHRRRWPWMVAVVGGSASLAAAASWAASPDTDTRCSGAASQLDAVWNDETKTTGRAAFAATGLSYAETAWAGLAARVDEYGERWVALHRETCEATSIEGVQSSRDLDLKMRCLSRARSGLNAMAEVVRSADARVVERAHELDRGLPQLDRCRDVASLDASANTPPAEIREHIEQIRDSIAKVEILRASGRYDAAVHLAHSVVKEARATEFPPLYTEALLKLGYVEQVSSDLDASEHHLRLAMRHGLEHEQWWLSGWAGSMLVAVVGYQKGQWAEGLAYAGQARALFERAGSDPEALSGLHNNVATVLELSGAYEDAEAEHLASLALRVRAYGDDDLIVASSHHNLAAVFHAQGRYDDSESALRRALEIRVRSLGDEHPLVADTHNSLGVVLRTRGDYQESIAEQQRALEIRQRVFGVSHPLVAHTRNNMANAHFILGEYELAEQEYRQTEIVFAQKLGEDHRDVAMALSNIANTLYMQGRYAEAAEAQERALDIRVKHFGQWHSEVADAHNNLAISLQALGRLGLAEVHARAAVASKKRSVGLLHPGTAMARGTLANVLRAQGKLEGALREQTIALKLRIRAFGDQHVDVAESHHNLAQVLWELNHFEVAEEHYRAAIDIREEVLGSDHPEAAKSMHALGSRLIERGRDKDARELLGQAWKVLQVESMAPDVRADVAFALAQAVWPLAAQRTRALALARTARRLYGLAGPRSQESKTLVSSWIGSR